MSKSKRGGGEGGGTQASDPSRKKEELVFRFGVRLPRDSVRAQAMLVSYASIVKRNNRQQQDVVY